MEENGRDFSLLPLALGKNTDKAIYSISVRRNINIQVIFFFEESFCIAFGPPSRKAVILIFAIFGLVYPSLPNFQQTSLLIAESLRKDSDVVVEREIKKSKYKKRYL